MEDVDSVEELVRNRTHVEHSNEGVRGEQGWRMCAPDLEMDDMHQSEQVNVEVSFVARTMDAHLLNIPSAEEEVGGFSQTQVPRVSGVSMDRMAHFLYRANYTEDMELEIHQLEQSLGLNEAHSPLISPLQFDSQEASFGSYHDSCDWQNFHLEKFAPPLDYSPYDQSSLYEQGGFSGATKEADGDFIFQGGATFHHDAQDNRTDVGS